MSILKRILFFIMLIGIHSTGWSAETVYHEYYKIDERNLFSANGSSADNGFNEFSTFIPDQFLKSARNVIINLLQWTLHNEERPLPSEKYLRKIHFGRWINDPTDDTCMNTRAKVLVRDSEEEVTFRNNRQCVVDTGKWFDAYADQELTTAREIQIDHMVPLKNAYMSGAWQWDYNTRCLYANYMGYKHHLAPASVHENTAKGDRGPDRYLPSNLSYRCQYIRDWLAIKLIWNLNMTADEVESIHQIAITYSCPTSDFNFTKASLEAQRKYILNNIDFCSVNKR